MGTLRGRRRQNSGQNLGRQLAGRSIDLMARFRALSFKGRLRCLDALLGCLADGRKGRFPLHIPLVDTLLPAFEYLGAGGTELRLVFLRANVGLSNGEAGPLHRAGGPLSPLGANLHQLAVQNEAVGEYQNDKQDQGRYGTDCKISKLAQQFIHLRNRLRLSGNAEKCRWNLRF